MAPGADLRVDVPRYRVYRHGALAEEVDDLNQLWRPDFVAFLLGCSYTADAALLRGGVPLRYIEQGTAVGMYRTTRVCRPAPFHGPLVVSMRPIPTALVDQATRITARQVRAHGAPVTSATRPRWASPIWRTPTTATPCPSRRGRSRCSGAAA